MRQHAEWLSQDWPCLAIKSPFGMRVITDRVLSIVLYVCSQGRSHSMRLQLGSGYQFEREREVNVHIVAPAARDFSV